VNNDDFLLQTQALTEADSEQTMAISDRAWAQAGAQATADLVLQARANSLLAAVAVSRGEFADAVMHGNIAIGLALTLGRADLLGLALHPGATAMTRLGEHVQAIQLFDARLSLAPTTEPASLVERVVAGVTEAEAWLGYSRSIRSADDATGLASALAQARELAERACGAACELANEGSMLRLRVLAFEILTDVLLEADDLQGARAWRLRVCGANGLDGEPGSWLRAVFELNALKIDMHEAADSVADLARVTALEAGMHACFQSGRRHRQLMQCLWRAFERCGDFRNALIWRKRWVQAQAQVEAIRAREQQKLTQRALQALRGEAQDFITSSLRAPLKAALGNLTQVQGAEVQDTTRLKVQKAARSTQRALDMTAQYLSLMQAEYTQHQELKHVDLGEIARDVCQHASLMLPAQVVMQQDIESGIKVLGEPGLLNRALANLVENARAHAPAGSVVRVQLSRHDGAAVLSVSDQGPGLPLAMRTRLFERYASGRSDGGNGLGLALVARVARLHHARVAVQTQEGQGTTVSLSMQVVPSGAAQAA
jgi:signal transduction histidine kinase